mmetsp:Transcript_37619/g.76736  ORF Transcript_37619/g.76736 Transcript_37619/m.76736 type:complete len:205 (+) Transcript_37619:939-1553(+)
MRASSKESPRGLETAATFHPLRLSVLPLSASKKSSRTASHRSSYVKNPFADSNSSSSSPSPPFFKDSITSPSLKTNGAAPFLLPNIAAFRIPENTACNVVSDPVRSNVRPHSSDDFDEDETERRTEVDIVVDDDDVEGSSEGDAASASAFVSAASSAIAERRAEGKGFVVVVVDVVVVVVAVAGTPTNEAEEPRTIAERHRRRL